MVARQNRQVLNLAGDDRLRVEGLDLGGAVGVGACQAHLAEGCEPGRPGGERQQVEHRVVGPRVEDAGIGDLARDAHGIAADVVRGHRHHVTVE